MSEAPVLPRRRLPIGVQTFAQIVGEGYYYVDKTDYAWRLAERGKYYFLSRPRRFGKSLFVDTLKELYEGNEPLFRGLAIHDRWDWTARHPVIVLSFAPGVLKGPEALDERIREMLDEQAARLQVSLTHRSLVGRFDQLLRGACARHGRRAVVLVDEYDKPILDHLTDPPTAREMRDGLRNLYSVIKGADASLQLVLITGVSKFSKVSLFSGLYNLNDITVDAAYSAVCGYTDRDVDGVFAPELGGFERDRIRHWYNGYSWLGEPVYNPFDLLLLFDKREFRPWWFETGTPTFLVRLLAARGFFTPDLARLRTSMEILSAFDVDYIAPEALLFQTGYLSLKQAEEPITGYWVYTLGYPNHEVEASLNASLLGVYTPDPSRSQTQRLRLLETLLANDLSALKAQFQALLAGVPHHWYDQSPIAQYEGYYASVFYSHFAALGLDITLEDATNRGRIDMTVRFRERVYLFEFKVVELVPAGRALQQIKDRGYAEKYRGLGWPMALIGVEFSRTERNIVGFEVEEIPAG